ncbi:uncharacterized protein EV420DRAFT_1727161 [Desarmillaria tabescens]|uniref:Uncharacterized protein n=1 Tax=Armillaria tabescens TaxID=1929756 RepID=A0AA39JGR6_ARMTA|nr:uncharacterized protein EV420DRAFT_1727161 [Desarmillaria tabescens]KAK0442491.1 hypothetical protein EV420DRAFT_1727161 [Desarmillaria tabescens]
MPSNTSSDIVHLSHGAVPHFGEDYDVHDPVAERQYNDQLTAFRQAWHRGRSLSVGDSFDVTLTPIAKPEGGCDLPLFAHNEVIICSSSPISFSLSWNLRLIGLLSAPQIFKHEFPTSVILKIFQGSLLPVESRTPFTPVVSPKQLAGCENYAYNELKDLQGAVIPYYYGKHKLAMKNGEVVRVLVLEHIHGLSLEEWFESFPEHHDVEDSRTSLPFYDTMHSQRKVLTKQTKLALRGITEINKRGSLQQNISA